jgi:hypothetical protein
MNRALSLLFLLGLIVAGSSLTHKVQIPHYAANHWSYHLQYFIGLNQLQKHYQSQRLRLDRRKSDNQ